MAWKDYLSHFRQGVVADPNLILLKKYLLCVQQGWFRINGVSPDKNYHLGNYLFDDERVLLDFTHLSDEARKNFTEWFLSPHKDKHITHFSPIQTNDYRGYTAEVELSWWGRLMNLLLYRKKAYHWPFSSSTAKLGERQLQGISVYPGENGLFINVKQNKTESTNYKYSNPQSNQDTPFLNVKRVFLNNELVSQLQKIDLSKPNYDEIIASPHPFAIPVDNKHKRFREMSDYRIAEKLEKKQYWYQRVFNFIVGFFWKNKEQKSSKETAYDPLQFKEIIATENATVLHHPESGEVIVMEKRPELDSMVFCGGGAKIFGHVGALQAFEEAGICPQKYAGSSAGAIMALLAYLGCPSSEIKDFFKRFRQENLVHYESYQGGISDTQALKSAVDYMIIKKVQDIITNYSIDQTVEGKRFLATEVFPKGLITFGSLLAIKKRYPDCPFGKELVVTATIKERRETLYFSCEYTPDMEVSDAVRKSASFPLVFKPTLFEGEPCNDGGVLSNFPTEAFHEDDLTFLFSEKANYLRLVAFQFDNDGTERTILEKAVDRVYRENFIWNWIYGMITGVKDPVSGWERDRLKLLLYINQTVLIDVANVSSTQFTVDEPTQEKLFNNGYKAANDYIFARYKTEPDPDNLDKKRVVLDSNTKQSINEEGLYSRFASFEELLYFSCFKRCEKWFNLLAAKAIEQGMDVLRIEELRAQYFSRQSVINEQPPSTSSNNLTLFNHHYDELLANVQMKKLTANMRSFEVIYPFLLNFAPVTLIKNQKDLIRYKSARHMFSLHNPFNCLPQLRHIKGEVHIIFALFKDILLSCREILNDDECEKIKFLSRFEESNELLFSDPVFFDKWCLLPSQTKQLIDTIKKGDCEGVKMICLTLKNKTEPSSSSAPPLSTHIKIELPSQEIKIAANIADLAEVCSTSLSF